MIGNAAGLEIGPRDGQMELEEAELGPLMKSGLNKQENSLVTGGNVFTSKVLAACARGEQRPPGSHRTPSQSALIWL